MCHSMPRESGWSILSHRTGASPRVFVQDLRQHPHYISCMVLVFKRPARSLQFSIPTIKPKRKKTPKHRPRFNSTQQVEGRLKQLQDDYDTLSHQAEFSADRAEKLESDLAAAGEDLRRAVAAGVSRACVAQRAYRLAAAEAQAMQEELQDAERRLDGETFFKTVQEGLVREGEETCALRDETIEGLQEELEVTRAYAKALRELLDEQLEDLVGDCAHAATTAAAAGVALRDPSTVEPKDSAAPTAAAHVVLEIAGGCARDADEAERRRDEAELEAGRAVEEMGGVAAEFARGEARLQGVVEELEGRVRDMEVRVSVVIYACVCIYRRCRAGEVCEGISISRCGWVIGNWFFPPSSSFLLLVVAARLFLFAKNVPDRF